MAAAPDPNTQKMMHDMMQMIQTPDGFIFFMAAAIILIFVVFLVLSTIGGAVSAKYMKQ